MAFCKYCGSPLEEGQVCTCPQAQQAAQQPQQPQAPVPPQQSQQPIQPQQPRQPGLFGTSMKKLGPTLAQYFKDPGQAARAAVADDNWILALFFTVVRVLAMGLACFGLFQGLVGKYMEVPFFSTLMQGVLVALIGTALYLVMLFAQAKIMKSTVSFKAAYIAHSVNGILVSAVLLVTFLLGFASSTIASLLLIVAVVSGLIFGVLTAQLLCPESQSGKFWFLYLAAAVLAIVAFFLVMYLLGDIWSSTPLNSFRFF